MNTSLRGSVGKVVRLLGVLKPNTTVIDVFTDYQYENTDKYHSTCTGQCAILYIGNKSSSGGVTKQSQLVKGPKRLVVKYRKVLRDKNRK